MSHQPTEQSFLKDVSDHQMHVLMDNGVYRHIRFKRPDTGCYHFDLITYPGYLVYSGDMGCYVFSRMNDMFQFFRTDRKHLRDGETLGINLGYWSEKLQAVDGSRHQGSATEFSEKKFERCIMEYLIRWIRDYAHLTTKVQRRELWDAVMNEVIGADGDGGGYRKQAAAYDFHYPINPTRSFKFVDIFEYDFTEYTHQFIWCCYALAWGIQQYDEMKVSEVSA